MREGAVSRRGFMGRGAGAAVAAGALAAAPSRFVHAAHTDELKVGLIGCGGRGTGAASQALLSTGTPVKLWAMGDLFGDQLEASHAMLAGGATKRYDRDAFGPLASKMDVPAERRFVGWKAHEGVLASGVDIVILATPPHFRAEHFEAAVAAGKHVFMEKPVAVDPGGVRRVIAAAQEAKRRGLSVVAGTQRRHQNHYREIIRRVRDGAIGEIVAAQCYWNMGALLVEEARAAWEARASKGWSEMEYQVRNWLFHVWLSGDQICEQHVHNLDIINWALGAHPISAMGVGGRQERTGPEFGNVFDHFAVEYEYPGGVRLSSMCRQVTGTEYHVCERLVGTRGQAFLNQSTGQILGPTPYKYDGPDVNPYYQEHADLIASVRSGTPLSEGVDVAETTMTGVLGRMSAYTGRALRWDWAMNRSKLDLRPARYEFGPLPLEPVAIPGKTKLV